MFRKIKNFLKLKLYYEISMKVFFIISTLFSFNLFHAQTVIGTQGNSSSNSACSLDYTIGEVVIAFGSDSSSILTQGFHQPVFEITTVETIEVNFDVVIYPNPAVDQLNLRFKEINRGDQFQLYDALGKQLVQELIVDYQMYIPFSNYSTGIYFLSIISSENKLIKTFKIQKSH